MNHIILIGFMGSGKTTVGKKLARKMKLDFVDTDNMVEAYTGEKISDIFARQGEAAFRRLETEMLRRLLEREQRCVISVGGGLPVQPENQPILKELGTVVYLKASVDTLVGRLRGDTSRPKLQGGDLRERIIRLMEQREDAYQAAADVSVVTDSKGFEQILKDIAEKTA